jgi:hypothetical protein
MRHCGPMILPIRLGIGAAPFYSRRLFVWPAFLGRHVGVHGLDNISDQSMTVSDNPEAIAGVTRSICAWFSNFLLNAFVNRVKRRLRILIVRLERSE